MYVITNTSTGETRRTNSHTEAYRAKAIAGFVANAEHVLPCGCTVLYPLGNNKAEKQRVKRGHEKSCEAFAKICAAHRDEQSRATAENAKAGKVSRSAFARGDDERHIVDAYWGEGTYDSEFTTDDMIAKAMGG